MTDETPAGQAETPEPVRPRRRWLPAAWHWSRRTVGVTIAIVAAVLVLTFTIDLGRFPWLKNEAEKRATAWLDRAVHIDRLSATLVPGVFVLDHVVIDGKHPGDRPFFEAQRIKVFVPLLSLLTRRLTVDLAIEDWRMVEEMFSDGASQPRLGGPKSDKPKTKLPFTTTVSVYALRGQFVYDDHMTPWSVNAPNLGFSMVRDETVHAYVGRAAFENGSVQILHYRPMRTDMTTRFVLDGTHVTLKHIDLVTEGTRSHVTGDLDFQRWPEQTYNINGAVDFARMREIFFNDQTWHLGGTGQFVGVFRLSRDGWRELAGNFSSEDAELDLAGASGLVFPHLHGSLVWTPDRFAVTHADADLLGGTTRFIYEMAPLRRGGSTTTFAADYDDVDLAGINRLFDLKTLQVAGRATGHFDAAWPTGHVASRVGNGHTIVTGPPNVAMASVELPSVPRRPIPEPQPFQSFRPMRPLEVAADVEYRLDANGWTFQDSWASTPFTYLRFKGRLATTGQSEFPFHATSHDWQESDRVLTRIMTAVSGPTGAIEVGGRGTFDGVMRGTFSAPRIEGHFAADDTRAWDVNWGHTAADLVIENHYVTVARGMVTGPEPGSSIAVDGRFYLGFSPDRREEINTKLVFAGWPIASLRHAFVLDDWPMDGAVQRATLSLTGQYKNMFGTGTLAIDRGVAWGEHFETATGDIDLEGTGMRIHRVQMAKGPGTVRGDIQIGWDGTYSFNADGTNIPVESLDNFKMPSAPLSGRMAFKAAGAGPFKAPVYDFSGQIDDLFVGDQGVGIVKGDLRVENNTLLLRSITANSGLLDVAGAGTIALNTRYDANLHMRFTQSSLDPYVKFFAPKLSPYVRAILSGAVDASGPLSTPMDVTAKATIGTATLTLLDYDLSNIETEPIVFTYDNQQFRVGSLKLRGGTTANQTNLELTGDADARARIWHLATNGAASLSILQAFFPGLTASGGATLDASLGGTFDEPVLNGAATIVDGRLRPLSSPHSLEDLNGRVKFGANGLTVDPSAGMTGRVATGAVKFGGSIAMEGYRLSEFRLTAEGRSMQLRYPVGFRSLVNMNLALVGPLTAPRLEGNVDVLRVRYLGTGSGPGVFGIASLGSSGGIGGSTMQAPEPGGTPIVLNLSVNAPSRLQVLNSPTLHLDATGDLRVNGTFDQPAITGTIEILGGDAIVAGNRYDIREGTMDFRNPDRIEPTIDLSAETRPRVGDRTYNVQVRLTGTIEDQHWAVTSDPVLPTADIVSLITGSAPDINDASQRALRSPQEAQQRMLQNLAGLFIGEYSMALVEGVTHRAIAVDVVQITPYLQGDTPLQQLANPTARVTLGKRISPKVFLTYSRTLAGNGPQYDEVILLEYTESDRVSWVLSRDRDHNYALDFRIR